MTHNSTDILFQISQFVNPISVLVHFSKNFFATCSPVSTQSLYLACHHKFKIHTPVSRITLTIRGT